MQLKGLDVAYIHSQRVAELARWFGDCLGLATSYEDADWHEFHMPSGSRFAVDKTSFPRSVVESQPIVLSFLVDDIHGAVAQLSARGVSFFPSVDDCIFDVGPRLVATFADPDGNWHQLSQAKESV